MNSHADNCAYWLDVNNYVKAQDLFHHKYAHIFPEWADLFSELMTSLGGRPVRGPLTANTEEYENQLAMFEDVATHLIQFREICYGVADEAEMHNDREVIDAIDSFLRDNVKYFKQVSIWQDKAGKLSPQTFDRYFDGFTII